MDAELEERVRALLRRSQELEWGLARVMLAEEAVRLADLHGDVELGYEAREVLVKAAVFSDLDERGIAPFTWCLAAYDRDPQRFPRERTLLWQYKWICGSAVGWPQVALERVQAMMDDMERRHRQHGFSARSAYKYRLELALLMGDAGAARAMFRRWQSTPRDAMSDCVVCERDQEVQYHIRLGDHERALTVAAPILSGALRCETVPRITLGEVLLPLLRLKRLEEAMRYHHKGYRLTARNPKWVENAAHHIVFLALTGHLVKALHLFESHFPFPHDAMAADRFDRFVFFLAARFLMECLGAAGRTTIKLRLAESFPAHEESGQYDVAALGAWFEAAARRIAARFDARHGQDGFRRRITANLVLKELVTPYPLRPARSERSA